MKEHTPAHSFLDYQTGHQRRELEEQRERASLLPTNVVMYLALGQARQLEPQDRSSQERIGKLQLGVLERMDVPERDALCRHLDWQNRKRSWERGNGPTP